MCHQLQSENDRFRAAYKKLEGECSELRSKNGALTAQLIEAEAERDSLLIIVDAYEEGKAISREAEE